MAGAPTALAKLGFGESDPVDVALNFASFDPGVSRELGNFNGTRGKFWNDDNRMLETRHAVQPSFSSEPTAPELAVLLKWIMGGTPTGSTTKTYPWSNTAAARYLHFKPNVGEEWFLSEVGVNEANFTAASGGALTVDLGLIGKTSDATRTNFPSLTYDTTLQPFILSHLVFTVGGVARAVQDISFTVSGGIDTERFLNSLTLTALLRVSASLGVSFSVPSGDNASQFWRSGVTGASATAVFTNPTTSAVFTLDFPKLRYPGRSPGFSPGSEGFIRINAQPVSTAGGEPVTVSLNPGS